MNKDYNKIINNNNKSIWITIMNAFRLKVVSLKLVKDFLVSIVRTRNITQNRRKK